MVGAYDPQLVVLSVVVAIVASYTALDLAGRVSAGPGREARMWLVAGALAMGTGIWSMHFIGMLAFHLGVPMTYDGWLNAASWAIGVAASAVALFVTGRSTLTNGSIAAGATVMGLGIAAMHYTGMAAMQVVPPIVYDVPLFVASIVIAIVASLAALWLAFRLRRRYSAVAILAKLGSAVAMGLGIAAMHYTGMAAARFAPDTASVAAHAGMGMDDTLLAQLIGLASLSLLSATLVISSLDAYRAVRIADLASSLQLANEQLRAVALHDTLTGLPNRVLLEDRLDQAMSRATRSGKPFAVMFVDLDRFKPVNDTFGHRVGDELLKVVGQRLAASLRRADTVARTGGDEFIIVLSELGRTEDAAMVGGKVLAELARPIQVEGHQLGIGCSIGISLYPKDARDVKTLMVNADMAMYHAKQSGRNRYSFFVPEMLPGRAGG